MALIVTLTLMHQVADWKQALVASGGWFRTSYLELALAKRLTRIGLRIPSCNPAIGFNRPGGSGLSLSRTEATIELKTAASKIHMSFDGWTTKGGKLGFFGVVAHYATAEGVVKDLAIDLPQLSGVRRPHGERIASCIQNMLRKFGITTSKLSYFMLDNAYNNNAAIKTLSSKCGFVASHRRDLNTQRLRVLRLIY